MKEKDSSMYPEQLFIMYIIIMSEDNEGPTCINREVEDCAISLNRADLSFVTNCSAQEMRMVLSDT